MLKAVWPAEDERMLVEPFQDNCIRALAVVELFNILVDMVIVSSCMF